MYKEHPFIAKKLAKIFGSVQDQCQKPGMSPGFGFASINKLFDFLVTHHDHVENIAKDVMDRYGSLSDQCFQPGQVRQYVIGSPLSDSEMNQDFEKRLERVKRARDRYLFVQALENPDNVRWMERVASDYIKDKGVFELMVREIRLRIQLADDFEEHKKHSETLKREKIFVENENSQLLRGIETLEISYNRVCQRLQECENILISANEKDKTSNGKKGENTGEEERNIVHERTNESKVPSGRITANQNDVGTQAPESMKSSCSHSLSSFSSSLSSSSEGAKGASEGEPHLNTVTLI